jgi:predicted Zn-dependent protease
MRLKLLILAASLASFSGIAGGFDLGKLIEEQLKRDSAKPAPTQPAPTQTAPAQTAPATQPATQPAKPKFDPFQLGLTLLKDYSVEEEMRIGHQIAGNMLGAAPLVNDNALQQYVNLVGNWVAQQSGRNDIPWRFGVLDDETINAFAAPGGYVFVTKGLYRRLTSEAELAGVLGHEIAHVSNKHHLKLLKKSSVIGALGEAAGRKVEGSDQIVQNLIGNGAEIVARGLDKNAEYEADRIGMVLTARAGYDVYALPAVLAEIGHVAKGDKSVSLLFKTHPLPEDRLEHLSEAAGDRLDGLPEGQTGEKRFYRLR